MTACSSPPRQTKRATQTWPTLTAARYFRARGVYDGGFSNNFGEIWMQKPSREDSARGENRIVSFLCEVTINRAVTRDVSSAIDAYPLPECSR